MLPQVKCIRAHVVHGLSEQRLYGKSASIVVVSFELVSICDRKPILELSRRIGMDWEICNVTVRDKLTTIVCFAPKLNKVGEWCKIKSGLSIWEQL
jgi:hypothetical protein